MNIEFKRTPSLRITAEVSGGVSKLESKSVDSLLLFSILEKLEDIRMQCVDIENAVRGDGR